MSPSGKKSSRKGVPRKHIKYCLQGVGASVTDGSHEEEQKHHQHPAGPATSDRPCNDSLSPGTSDQRARLNENGQLHQDAVQTEPLDFSRKRRTHSPASSSANVGEFGNSSSRMRCAIPAPCIPQYNNDLRRTPGPSWMATEAASLLQPSTPLQALNYTNGLSGAGTNFVARVPNTPLMTARSPQTDRLYDSAAAPPALVRPPLSQQPAFPGLEPAALRSTPPSYGPTKTAGKHVHPLKAYQNGEVREGIPNSSRNGRKQDRNQISQKGAATADSEHHTKSSSPPARKDSGKNRSNGEVDGDCAYQNPRNSSAPTTTNNGEAGTHGPDTEDPKIGARNDGGDSPPDVGAASAAGPIRNGPRHARSPNDEKDSVYQERRRKNNEAARKSRVKRRLREKNKDILLADIEQKNKELRIETETLRSEVNLLREQVLVLTGTHQQDRAKN
ncbi:hypothetical protein HPB50_012711 [Hyalomma asiaticum]|uniref:Uncharacterized protein n=1 Tax=Hyalomma asiaticum TaxID=266040 RepID=A0ACB7RVY2_HYAAI|nr:hypothetical protein HPB50_012711 [Hyalomma asiaticum]